MRGKFWSYHWVAVDMQCDSKIGGSMHKSTVNLTVLSSISLCQWWRQRCDATLPLSTHDVTMFSQQFEALHDWPLTDSFVFQPKPLIKKNIFKSSSWGELSGWLVPARRLAPARNHESVVCHAKSTVRQRNYAWVITSVPAYSHIELRPLIN